MSWYSTGYEDLQEKADKGYDGDHDNGIRRHWQPPNTMHRLLFLDDEPVTYFEHQFKLNGSWRNWAPCRVRNKMDDFCFLCDHFDKSYPSYIGGHTVIDMTPWTSKKGATFCFGRKMFVAKLGGKDKPGVLRKLSKLKKKHGRLRGLVFDVERTGSKTESCGDDFDLVEKIDPEDIAAYRDEKMAAFVDQLNENLDGDKKLTVEQLLKRNPWEPLDFRAMLEDMEKKTNAVMKNLIVGGNKNSDFSDDNTSTSKDNFDDDIPF